VAKLFDPITLRGVTIRNRLWLPPMCQYSADAEGNHAAHPNAWHLQHYAARSVGGFGTVIVEATAVNRQGRISPYCLSLEDEADVAAFARLADTIRLGGATPAIQLNHAGRKASGPPGWERSLPKGSPLAWQTVAPSAVPFSTHSPMPTELSEAQIEELIAQFARSARLAVTAGFDVIELHAAHGYLIHQFLSPTSNRREDRWGGSFENRSRFLLAVIDAVRAVIADAPLIVRLSASDWLEFGEESDEVGYPGWTLAESVELARTGAEHGVDFWDVSSAGNIPYAPPRIVPGYQVPFAQKIRCEAGVPTSAVGLIRSAGQAEQVLVTGQADAVEVGRVALHDPYVANRWHEELDRDATVWPLQYQRG
jgi:2,4-dienoyl-CoA reductase-like NADH-dependent reductase (Old Yellow Enzyme family)